MKTEKFIESYRRGYFPPTDRKLELRKALGLDKMDFITSKRRKTRHKLSRADVLDVLHRVYIKKEPYAAIAARWGITVSYVCKMT